jgi:hypothetical protein
VLAVLAALYAASTPAVAPTTAPETEFSGARAFGHVRRIASRPHPSGSEAHKQVIAYISDQLKALGLTPEYQDATGVGTRYAVAGNIRNILVRIPGMSPGGMAVLVAAHYDGVPAGPAAADDGAGSAALLETIRALKAGQPVAHDVIALFTDSEEAGLLGAAAFVREHPWAKDVGVVLNFEARGVNGPSLMFETGRGNLDVASALGRAPGARGTSLSTAVYRRLPNDTDLSEFSVLDKPAMNFAFIGGVDRYHTTEDDTLHLSVGSLQHHGQQMLALTREFGNGPLPRPVTPDAVFFFVPGLGSFAYAEWMALPLAILVLLSLFAKAAIRKEFKPGWVRAAFVGAGAGLMAPVAGGVIGYCVGAGVTRLHQMIGSGTPRMSSVYAGALALLVAAAVLAMHSVAVRGRDRVSVERGVFAWWGIVSVLVAATLAGGSFLFTWPLIGGVIAAAAAARTHKAFEVQRWIGIGLVVLLVAPTAYLMVVMALGLDAVGGVILGVLSAMGVSLVAPHVTSDEKRGRLPLAAAAAGVLLFVFGAATVRTNAEHPEGSSLVLAADADSAGTWLTGFGGGPRAAAWVTTALDATGGETRAAPPWIRRTTGGRRVVALPGPKGTAVPVAAILKDSSMGTSRRVTLRLKTPPGALSLGLSMTGAVVNASAVNGRTIARDRLRRQGTGWSLEFVAPPDSGFTLTLDFEAPNSPELWMTARSAGIGALPGTPAPRPAGVLPIQSGDMTVVFKRLKL